MSWLRRNALKNRSGNQKPLTNFDEVLYAVGDIHGRCDLLDILLNKIEVDFQNIRGRTSFPVRGRVVFLGDYIDRGPDTRDVLHRLLTFDIFGLTPVFLKGNHETVLLDALTDPSACRAWLQHGGDATMLSYGVTIDPNAEAHDIERALVTFRSKFPRDHRGFLENLKTFYQTETLFFVHAGVDPGKPLDRQEDEDYLWIRDVFLSSKKPLPLIVVHGHTPQSKPSWDGRRIGVDTGAYFTNTLNSARIRGNTVEFIST